MNTFGFVKGMAAGLIVGAAITMAVDPVTDRQRRKLKKKTHSMARRLSYTLDNAMSKI